jgi:hypothetical protein
MSLYLKQKPGQRFLETKFKTSHLSVADAGCPSAGKRPRRANIGPRGSSAKKQEGRAQSAA